MRLKLLIPSETKVDELVERVAAGAGLDPSEITVNRVVDVREGRL